ncbi:GPN-loop GTPase 3 isoform X1 [Musca domestica]|uniref:GPN-loop GTPase 3 n=2 Tax=Musca domestica TaxID=7370 RepID=T1PKW3_MUSDO|nr:GPN-loop GTPase 3 isoform X1 [Musca domestica]
MRYAQVVIGPAGSGKSTYCSFMQRHAQDSKRVIEVVNLDPAAEHFDYQPLVDIRDLIQLDDAMDDEELHYGPNGGLVFCLEFLIENQDWLKNQLCGGGGGDDGDEVAEELGGEPDDDYILFDMPGQIELFTHLNMGKQLVQLLESWNFRICTVFLVDSQFMIDGAKFLSGTMAALSVMANLEMPHVNVLTKMDLLSKGAKKQLDKYLDPDARALLGDVTEESAWGRQHRKLSAAIGSLIEDFSLVRFVPMNVDDEESIQDLLLQIDNVIQYGEDADVKVHDFDPPEEEEGDEGTCRNIFDM